GGHTHEMGLLLHAVDPKVFHPRIYILADTDANSLAKARKWEEAWGAVEGQDWHTCAVVRTREVGGSFVYAVARAVSGGIIAIKLLWKHRAGLVLCNGPGTCVPVCLAAFVLRMLRLRSIRTVFVESLARVNDLSLTGKILYWFVDRIIVQWPSLKAKWKGVEYTGRLV
ncbi:oligosaccharide biosynthesis protein Alg14-like protein, partial [Gaertneriomyces semiglobifer]